MINPNDALERLSPEQVVDLLMPPEWGDADFGAFVADLDNIRDLNEWWLVLTPHGVREFVESAEVY